MKQYFLYALLSFAFFSSCQTMSESDEKLSPVEIFYPNGNKKIEGFTKNNKKHGLAKTYYESGQIRSETLWDNGLQNGVSKQWFENGFLKSSGFFTNDKYSGIWKYYSPNDGSLIYSVNSESNKVTSYFPNKNIKTESFLINEKKEGTSRTYYLNGQVETENNWTNDIQVGTSKKWFKNGKLQFEGQLESGKESGIWKYYDEIDGSRVYNVLYENGVVEKISYVGEKYRWRSFKQGDLKLQLPSFTIDSIEPATGIKIFWTMFPYMDKRSIEHYSITVLKSQLFDFGPKTAFINSTSDGLTEELTKLLNSVSASPEIPSIRTDKYVISEMKEISQTLCPIYRLEVTYTELDLTMSINIIPFGENIYVASAYFNKNVKKKVRDTFLNSLEIVQSKQ